MLAFIGFGIIFTPFMGIGFYGLGRLYKRIGIVSTIFLLLSLPFYIFTVSSMFKNIINYMNNLEYSIVNNLENGLENRILLDSFTIKTLVAFFVLLVLSIISARIHNRNQDI